LPCTARTGAWLPGDKLTDFQRAFRLDANGVNQVRKGGKKLGVE